MLRSPSPVHAASSEPGAAPLGLGLDAHSAVTLIDLGSCLSLETIERCSSGGAISYVQSRWYRAPAITLAVSLSLSLTLTLSLSLSLSLTLPGGSYAGRTPSPGESRLGLGLGLALGIGLRIGIGLGLGLALTPTLTLTLTLTSLARMEEGVMPLAMVASLPRP